MVRIIISGNNLKPIALIWVFKLETLIKLLLHNEVLFYAETVVKVL